jgi:hypothetical protein
VQGSFDASPTSKAAQVLKRTTQELSDRLGAARAEPQKPTAKRRVLAKV